MHTTFMYFPLPSFVPSTLYYLFYFRFKLSWSQGVDRAQDTSERWDDSPRWVHPESYTTSSSPLSETPATDHSPGCAALYVALWFGLDSGNRPQNVGRG